MKSTSGCSKLATLFIVLLGIFALVAVSLFILIDYASRRQRDALAQYAAPLVSINSPEDGFRAAAGSHMSVSGTVLASPQTPVKTIEWWLDGTRLESQPVQPGTGDSISYVYYDLLVPTEGNHLLFLRAINSLGVIGNSQPVTFQGTAKGDAYYAATLAPGETLENLAANYGVEIAALQNLNPGVGNAPPAGTTIKVPVLPENEPASAIESPSGDGTAALLPTAPMLKVSEASPWLVSLLVATLPQAPTNLQGEVKDCKVKLIWQDNATNEIGYDVWMSTGKSALIRLARIQPAAGGIVGFEFQAPGPGYFVFWVEAVNPIGAQGSNMIYLDVDQGCPAGAPTHLQVEILDIAVNASADRVYCYISFENTPEVRLPHGDGNFISVQNGHGDLVSWPQAFGVAIPPDGILDITGQCWGWLGNNLKKLGNFAASLDSKTWTGLPVPVQGAAFAISLSLSPQGQTAPNMKYISSTDDPTPYNLRFEREEDPNWPGCEHGCWVLRWDFKSAPYKDSDYQFDIHWYEEKNPSDLHKIRYALAGHSRATVVDYHGTQEDLFMLFGCEKVIVFDIAADNRMPGSYLSATHGQLSYALPKCPASLTVTFDTLELPWTGEGLNPGPCDDIDVYYTLMVNDQRKDFWGGCSFGTGCFLNGLKCGTYSFKQLAPDGYPDPDRFTVSAYSENLALKIVTLFYDYDWGSGDDVFAPFVIEHAWPTRLAAETDLGCKGKSFTTDMHVNSTADSKLHYTISIFPNPCQPYQP